MNNDQIFSNAIMTLMRSNGEIIAQHLNVQLDTVNIPWNMEVGATIPTDWYDLFSLGWTSPIPQRSNYFMDESSGVKYGVFGNPTVYFDHIEVRISRYSGETP